MTWGIELFLVGKVTYYALAVYFLFFIGVFLAIRQKFKQREGDSPKSNGVDNFNPGEHEVEDVSEEEGSCSPIREEMGTTQSKANDSKALIDRVEFTNDRKSAEEDAQVKILTKCVLQKPAGNLSYEIVHDFENDRGTDNNLRQRTSVKSYDPTSSLPINGSHCLGKGFSATYCISHTEYKSQNGGQSTVISNDQCDVSEEESCEIIEPLVEAPSTHDVCASPSAVNLEPSEVSEDFIASYAILTSEAGKDTLSKSSHLPKEIDLQYYPEHNCSNSLSKGSSFDEIALCSTNDYETQAENGSLCTKHEIHFEQSIPPRVDDDSYLVCEDSQTPSRESHGLFCLANAVVKQSLQESLNELQGNAALSSQSGKESQRTHTVNGLIEKHANELAKEVLSRALFTSIDYIEHRRAKEKARQELIVRRNDLSLCSAKVSDFSRELSQRIIQQVVSDPPSRLSPKPRKSLPRRSSSRSSSIDDGLVNKFGSVLAKSVQSDALGYLHSNRCCAPKSKSPSILDLTEFSNSLTESVLNDAYSRIKVGQYARRMSENIAVSACDSAKLILASVKEQDHYFCDLADRIIGSAYDQVKETFDPAQSASQDQKMEQHNCSMAGTKTRSIDENQLSGLISDPLKGKPQIMISPGKINDTNSELPTTNGVSPGLNRKNRLISSDSYLSDEDDQLLSPTALRPQTSDVSDTSEDERLPRKAAPVLRQKPILKGDRPLSGYAEKLAELLAEDDDDLEFLESDDELEKKSDEVEIKYSPRTKTGMGNSRLRRISSANESCNSDDSNSPRCTTGDNFDFFQSPRDGKIPPLNSGLVKEYSDEMDALLKGTKAVMSSVFSPRGYYKTAAVVDAGCGVIKAGMAGQLMPLALFPSLVGTPKRYSQDIANMNKSHFVGYAAAEKASMLHIDHPLRSRINNWGEVHSLLEYTLESELGICDSEHPLLLTELALKDKNEREKLTEIVFERLGMPAYCLCTQGPLTLYSMGLVSGMCVNAGFFVTQAESIFEGYTLPRATAQLDVGGDTIANYLGRLLLSTRGLSFNSSSEKRLLSLMMESTAYVTNDIVAAEARFSRNLDDSQVFTLPDGQEMELGLERCECTEILFDPSVLGLGQRPLPELITNSIASADVDIRDQLAKNIVLSGGTSVLSGFLPRLESEVKKCSNYSTDIKIVRSSEPQNSAWLGGSLLASLSAFNSQWLTMDEYAEQGASVIHARCF